LLNARFTKSRTVVVNGFSKAFSMTGWRLGYAAGPQKLIAAMQMIQDQSTSNASSFSQKAAVAALQGPTTDLEVMVREFKARRDFIVNGLNQIPGVKCRLPEGAFYAFPNVGELIGRHHQGQAIKGSVHLSEILLEKYLVAAVPGEPFGAEGYLRFSFATSPANLEKGLNRLKEFVGSVS
jgi:aspartate aminotransferase